MFWRCEPDWQGETAFVIGCGPSARGFDPECLRGRRVVALKNYFREAPWADMTFFADNHWWREYCEGRPDFGGLRDFPGEKVTIATRAEEPWLKRMRKTGVDGLELIDRSGVRGAFTSLHFVINILVHKAVDRIVLATGFDMELVNVDGVPRSHYHRGHKRRADPGNYARMIKSLATTVRPLAELGIEVVNCTPGGKLDLWPRAPLERFL